MHAHLCISPSPLPLRLLQRQRSRVKYYLKFAPRPALSRDIGLIQ